MSLPPIQEIADDALLKSQMKAMDFRLLCGDTNDSTVAEIIEKMNKTKADAEEIKRLNALPARYIPPGGWKSMASLRSDKAINKNQKRPDNSINRFHLPAPKWAKNQYPDKELKKVKQKLCFFSLSPIVSI